METELRIARTVHAPLNLLETFQGQVYKVGDFYQEHSDAFHGGEQEFYNRDPNRGQRTFTAMIYLNRVDAGGATLFPELGVAVVPTPGLALVWYNLDDDGKPHPLAKHASAPIRIGKKYVVTAWFREK
jgi:prolyl 4-hydroxylase